MTEESLINTNILENLSPDQRLNIVSLPYRVGLWISVSDQTGGNKADAKELLALSNIISGFASQVFGSELLQYVMQETVNRKGEWEKWTAHINNVPKEAEAALDVLRAHAPENEVKAYVSRLMEISEAVALAFREYENMTFSDKLRVYGLYIMSVIKGKFSDGPRKTFDQFLRISLNERKALNALAAAMGTKYAS